MIRILKIEIFKLVRNKKSYIPLIGFVIIAFLIYIGFLLDYPALLLKGVALRYSLDSKEYVNGSLYAVIVMVEVMWTLAPIFIAMVAGTSIAGEAQDGTLRFIMSKPISRFSLIMGKIIAMAVYTIIIGFIMSIGAYLIGYFGLRKGDLLVLRDFFEMGSGDLIRDLVFLKVYILDSKEFIVRYFLATGLGIFSMLTITFLSMLCSVCMENGANAMTISVMIFYINYIIMILPFFEPMHPFTFTYYMKVWARVFYPSIPWQDIIRDILFLSGFMVSFIIGSIVIFLNRDIIS